MLESLKTFSLTNRQRIADVLSSDPIGAAYLLADLEPPYFEHTQWFGAGRDLDDLRSMVMLYNALKVPALLTFGKAEGVTQVVNIRHAELPGKCHGMIWPGHEEGLEMIYKSRNVKRMIRMGLEKRAFEPSSSGPEAYPLKRCDLEDLTALMEHYPGNYFEPAMFSEDLYYGIRIDGRLVSAGGVHTYSPTYRVAALGNIVTHMDHRRRGLAMTCTSALVEKLFERVDHVALNVEERNEAAIRCYEGLGFVIRVGYTEGLFQKKELS